MKYKILWTDMHSNLHHTEIKKLPLWINQVKETLDFWPFAYYPYYMRGDESGMPVEDMYPLSDIEKDWEYIRKLCEIENQNGFPMFMGYEWQGAGKDGDHNVFFKDNNGFMYYPLRYKELVDHFKGKDVIGIPHHLAYQLDHRGKNWNTHDDKFSPFVEIYSSHGSSENDYGSISMNRHIHMGPRTGQTSVEVGWNEGYKFGCIASGDNHSVPGVYGFGLMGCLSKSNSKEDIWDAFINKRVYGVSRDRIKVEFNIDDMPMGSQINQNTHSKLKLSVEGSNMLDRIEVICDNKVKEIIPITSTWENKVISGKVKFKFQLELGWGPDRRIFKDISQRKWIGSLHTPGELVSIEKCWSNFGQKLENITKKSCDFEITSYKTTSSGKWMGPSAVTTEGFIFEIEDDIDSYVELTIDGKVYKLKIRNILDNSRLIPLMDEVEKLVDDTFGLKEYYRSDPWWHNAYKIKINRGAPSISYKKDIVRDIDTSKISNIRIKVYQTNGSVAWTSPIFINK